MNYVDTLDYGKVKIVPKSEIVSVCDDIIDFISCCDDTFYDIYYTAEKRFVAVESREE